LRCRACGLRRWQLAEPLADINRHAIAGTDTDGDGGRHRRQHSDSHASPDRRSDTGAQRDRNGNADTDRHGGDRGQPGSDVIGDAHFRSDGRFDADACRQRDGAPERRDSDASADLRGDRHSILQRRM